MGKSKKGKRRRSNNNTKKTVIIIVCIVAVLVAAAATVVILKTKKDNEKARQAEIEKKEAEDRSNQSKQALEEFMALVKEDKYDQMYEYLDATSKAANTKDAFVKRNKEFFDGISTTEVKVENVVSKDGANKESVSVSYSESIVYEGGELKFDNTVGMSKESDKWHLIWNESIMYPEISSTEKVKASVVEPVRGKILDRDGKTIAENVTSGNQPRKYALGDAAAHYLGYISKISADELKEDKTGSYKATSLIGKKGLEYAFESTLRGKCGSKVSIVTADGAEKKVLTNVEAENGKDFKSTVDSKLQKAIYSQLKGENACSVAINPYTGEILAMVSTPSYDNNGIYSGAAADTYNRFARRFCPGSTFKSVTAAVGLTSGSFTADTDFGASTKRWQPDSSWGKLYITTQHAVQDGKLINGLTLSDNVFFAKAALKIGKTKLAEGLDKIGFGKKLPIEMNFDASQYSNGKGFTSEALLANSGYGQGEILVNPLHMASIYSAFLNEGKMVQPCFTYDKTKYWIEDAFTADAAKTVRDCLINVVESPEGTGHPIYTSSMKIGGKTGTAEIKASQSDENGIELGWFIAFTADKPQKDAVLIVTMIEDVEAKGGSAYVVKKTKNIFNEIF